MPSATLVLDSFRLRDRHGGNVSVEQVSDYPPAYLALREAVHGGSPLEIIVHDRTAAEWLRRAAAAYGPDHIELVELTPRALLADRWGIAVPTDISDHDILR